MKSVKLLLIGLLAFVLNSCLQDNSVTIKGKFIGELIPEKIDYTIPINGSAFWGFKGTTSLDSVGNFEISVKLPATAFISLQLEDDVKYMIIEPKVKSYEIIFDLSRKGNELTVNSENEEGQQVVSKFNYFPPNSIKVSNHFINDLASIDEMIIKIKEAKQEELKPLQKLLDEKKISSDFFNTAKTDRECYYNIVQAVISTDQVRKTDEKEKVIESWESSFQAMNKGGENYFPSTYFNVYLEKYVEFMSIRSFGFDTDEYIKKIRPIYEKGGYHAFVISEAKKVLKGDVLEFFIASYIYYSAYQNNYEKELILLFKQFANDFPKSSYTKYVSPLIEEIVEYYIKVEGDLVEGINIIENREEFNSLNDITKLLKGKAIYIDVWATWCGPCKKEFEYKKDLDELLIKNDIQMLYISIDDDEKISEWENSIKFYELDGNHLRANKYLKSELEKIFGREDGAMLIPWYILIDKEGNIVKKFAKRPSQINELENEIKEL